LHRRLFAIILSLNTHILVSCPNGQVSGIISSQVHRIFMSRNMFIISIVLLSLNVFVAILYYLRRPKRFLPRMPTTLASIIAFVAASRALPRCTGTTAATILKSLSFNLRTKPHILPRPDRDLRLRFGFGKFIGTDGKPHVGIERHPLVVPLDLNALRSVSKERRRASKSNILGREKRLGGWKRVSINRVRTGFKGVTVSKGCMKWIHNDISCALVQSVVYED
jgi:hypothetical protein